MKHVGIAIILFASFCCAQEAGDFQPSSTKVWGAQYPRVDSNGRVQIRVKAPDATKVRVDFWSGHWRIQWSGRNARPRGSETGSQNRPQRSR
jgi:hypothetical protein